MEMISIEEKLWSLSDYDTSLWRKRADALRCEDSIEVTPARLRVSTSSFDCTTRKNWLLIKQKFHLYKLKRNFK